MNGLFPIDYELILLFVRHIYMYIEQVLKNV